MNFRENCKYALVAPTSMGVRICPASGQPVQSSDTLEALIDASVVSGSGNG